MAEYEKFQDRDYSGDQITPQFIHEQLRAHDKKMRDNRNQWALTKACYTTNYWKHVRHRNYTGKQHQTRDNEINVEVNRLFGIITAYLSALYPRAQRAIVMPDPNGIGDSIKGRTCSESFYGVEPDSPSNHDCFASGAFVSRFWSKGWLLRWSGKPS